MNIHLLNMHFILIYNDFYRLCQPASRRPVAFSQDTDMGLTDIEMAHGLEYDDAYFEERPYEIEYEVC